MQVVARITTKQQTFEGSRSYIEILFCFITNTGAKKQHCIQNTAARMQTGTKKRERITPVLASLHGASAVHFRIHFKILLMVFMALNGQAPPYIDLSQLQPASRSLRSNGNALLHIPQSQHTQKVFALSISAFKPELCFRLAFKVISISCCSCCIALQCIFNTGIPVQHLLAH